MQLRIPGPTPIPREVQEALSRDMINHRGPEFAAIIRELTAGLKRWFQTENDVFILSASGSGGMEAAIANTLLARATECSRSRSARSATASPRSPGSSAPTSSSWTSRSARSPTQMRSAVDSAPIRASRPS